MVKEIFSVDLTPQGYRHSLALPSDFPAEKLAYLKQVFTRSWLEKRPFPGVYFSNRFERTKDQYIATFDAIFKRESVIMLHQDVFYGLLPFLEEKRYHNKFYQNIATVSLPEYTTTPKRNIIARIGVELEGGWSTYRDCMKGDGSVSGMRHQTHPGEIPFPPFPPDEFPWVEEVSLPEFQTIRAGTKGSFTSMYPDYVNHTCGMHVHISFPSKGMYAAFVDSRFQPWLVRGLQRWGQHGKIKSTALYSRLNGEQSYCRNMYDPEPQLNNGGNRYTIVNYCYQRYNTMEIRVLPMFKDVRFSIKAIKALIKLVNIWGNEFGPKTGNPDETVRLSTFVEEEVERPTPKPKVRKAKEVLPDYDVIF